MSKQIKVTVLNQKEKLEFSYDTQDNFLTELLKHIGEIGQFCMGQGLCGRCKVCFRTGAPIPTPSERKIFSAEQLREGYRLACHAKPMQDCSLQTSFEGKKQMNVVTAVQLGDRFAAEVNAALEKEGKTIHEEKDTLEDTGLQESINTVRIAVDIGTTTIAMLMREQHTGKVLDTFCVVNPQSCYGADVLSRIQAACDGKSEELRQMVLSVLEQGVERFRIKAAALSEQENKEFKIKDMVIAANTTMGHLLMGYQVNGLGVSPFRAVNLKTVNFQISGVPTILYPGISTFVGGDITAGIYVCGMHQAEQVMLLLDLGTNGEMALGNRNRILTTATAAGPAFEGGATAGIWGADMIRLTAMLLEEGVLDETGLLQEPYFEEGIVIEGVHITQQHIRTLQMAKAAIRAGVEIIMRKYGLHDYEEIAGVFLAGGFGYHIDAASAVRVGLLPKKLKDRMTAVGNTALEGAFYYNKSVESIPKLAEAFQLAEQEEFQELYIDSMNFG